jgi:hypothetical protein
MFQERQFFSSAAKECTIACHFAPFIVLVDFIYHFDGKRSYQYISVLYFLQKVEMLLGYHLKVFFGNCVII